MEALQWAFIILLGICTNNETVSAVCTKPALSSNSYSLTEDKKEYTANETYEIGCIPGYTISGASVLTCQNNAWSSALPKCSPSDETYPWWLLLVAVMVVVLLISCILPRLLVCLCRKTPKTKSQDDRNGLQRHGDDDDDDDDDYGKSDSPTPDLSAAINNKMTNIEFMSELHKDKDLANLRRAKKNAVF